MNKCIYDAFGTSRGVYVRTITWKLLQTSAFCLEVTYISHLMISSWMTANLLTLNSSKTEFLLIVLKQQLCKIQHCSLTTTHSARNLGFIFDEHLTFSDQITALSVVAPSYA